MTINNLWAPWRMRYIETEDEVSDCIFCVKPAQKLDTENLILWRGESAFIIMNKFPYNNGHLMVVPYRHLQNITDLSEAESSEIHHLTGRCVTAMEKVLKAQGFNIGINLGRIAGAGIDQHIHYHVVPRWQGDTNFMPVIGASKVISQALEESYQRLREEFTHG